MVGRQTLALKIEVRVLAPQPYCSSPFINNHNILRFSRDDKLSMAYVLSSSFLTAMPNLSMT